MSLRERTRPGMGLIEPSLPAPAKAPPSGPGWIHEIKHDGFRILARKGPSGVRLITRNANDFTHRFPFIEMAIKSLPVRSCLRGVVPRRLVLQARAGAVSAAVTPLGRRRFNASATKRGQLPTQ